MSKITLSNNFITLLIEALKQEIATMFSVARNTKKLKE